MQNPQVDPKLVASMGEDEVALGKLYTEVYKDGIPWFELAAPWAYWLRRALLEGRLLSELPGALRTVPADREA